MPVTVPLPVRIDGHLITTETTLDPAAGNAVLIITTAAPDHALLLRTIYIGLTGRALAVDATQAPGGATLATRDLTAIPVTHDRGRCLTDHAEALQTALAQLTQQTVAIDLTDHAGTIAARSYPPAQD